ncbi:hypothetical protein [Actinobacillus vicugnae]|uniref:hypothetical protein n=1 Tax=Actinobacillus vicugnae TaxID=2573093 RepID=UPI00123F9693|nr:hypothetical protein [Actinobacillus vicugnae]
MYRIEYLEIFKNFFVLGNKCLVIPELWDSLDWNDENYINCISDSVSTYYHTDRFSPTFLYMKSKSFFSYLEKFNYFSIFTSIDISDKKIPLNNTNKFHLSSLYGEVEENLVFVGWNPRCSIGSAITDGRYPIYFSDNKNGEKTIIVDDNCLVNEFGLLKTEEQCQYICNLNNLDAEYNEGDYWYPSKLYVDQYTYKKIKNLP